MDDKDEQPAADYAGKEPRTPARTKWVYFHSWPSLLYVAGPLLTGLLLAVLLPTFGRARSEVAIARCKVQLTAIGVALKAYASEHDGAYPAALDGLLPGYLEDSEALSCPASDLPYTYVAGKIQDAAPDDVLVYDPVGSHPGRAGGHVLFANGDVEFLSPADHSSIIARTRRNLTRSVTQPASEPHDTE